MYKNNKFTLILPTVVAVSIAVGILLGGVVFKNTPPVPRRGNLVAPGSGKLNMLLSLIENRYVDTVSMDSITEKTIPFILEELDPHSVYVPAKDMAQMNESLDGEFDGIGVMFNMATDTVIVLNVINSGPSSKVGVLGGDRIITINDTIVAGVKMRQDEVMKRLRGPRGSKVKLGIQRVGVKDLVPITVTRGVIPIYCINAAYMIGPETGYIVFAQFSRNAHKELMDAVDRLKAQGMKKLILDIRSNPGGFLDQAIEIANEFLPARKMIVYTVERGGEQSRQYSNGKGRLQDIELAVLVDEGSASSSEILAGALQDNDRGTIIGRRTFGKGLVQEQIPFPDGSAVRLTIARYYTPSGRSIQKPYDKGSEDYNNDLMNRYEHNEMFSADSIHFADSLKYFTAGGRTVYGGGGIMPDRFVPADTTDITPYLREVTGRNIALPLYDRICRSSPQRAESNHHAAGTGCILRKRPGSAERIHPLCRPCGRRTETLADRTVESDYPLTDQSLRRTEYAARRQRFLPCAARHRQHSPAGAERDERTESGTSPQYCRT
ncbi:MAG: S41 family peptidase [Alistipes indistinctus]